MPRRRIRYPRRLRDLPAWRQRELSENILWFLRFSPSQRLEYIDREWEAMREYIERYGLLKR